ncbi:SDR family oxidoreductase [Roseomonas sp. AR75]|uniref:SDR family oxidoreductase n=1 Tax=Roseomonas sp. AR75 TaxID=2562311 RepID=UPI0010C07BD6|nr:SDR family oxidoreductase [Roseomonas sp. AR75]
MDLELAGRRALLLGSSRGIGLACAQRLAREGCAVAIHGRDGAAIAAACDAIRDAGAAAVHGFAANLAEPDAVTRLAEEALAALGGLEILVVNTGHLPYGGFASHGDTAWHDAFDLVVMSAVRVVRACLPALRTAQGAAIVFIGSASTREPRLHLLSNTMRAAVAGLAKTLAQEYAGDGIRVNTVAPGYIASGRIADRLAAMTAEGTPLPDAERSIAGGPLPLGRLGRTQEIADLVAMLASPRAGYVTGATLTADGGLNRALF